MAAALPPTLHIKQEKAEGKEDEEMGARRALRAVVYRVRKETRQLKTPVGLARSALRHALQDGGWGGLVCLFVRLFD